MQFRHVAAALALTVPAAAPPAVSPSFGADAVWDDGLAEVATYRASREIYGKPRPHEVVLVTVKEDFDRGKLVKADPPLEDRDLLPVLKLNAIATVPTDEYAYHFLTSAFVRREDPTRLVKLTVGSQEWCGNTFQMLTVDGDEGRLHWHSYFEPEADGEAEVALGPALVLIEDALPLQLRALRYQVGERERIKVLRSRTSNHARAPQVDTVFLKVESEETLGTAAGNIPTWRLSLTFEEGQDRYWIERAFPHVLVRMETTDGRTLELVERERRAYWK